MFNNYKEFLDKVFSDLLSLKIDTSDFKLDHIAYQTSSKDDYERLKIEIIKQSELVLEPIVGGRRVGAFKLHTPLKYNEIEIQYVEIIEPVEGNTPISQIDHVEFLTNDSFDMIVEKYPEVTFDLSSAYREEYAHLKLKLPSGLMVKFPKQSIGEWK